MTTKILKTGITAFIIILTAMVSCKNTNRIEYPETKKTDYADTLFGTSVPDPYRWLEDDMSEETAEWVREQNRVTFGYLEGIPYRSEIQERLTNMWNYEKFSLPHREGDYIYYSRNDGLQNQYVVYRQKGDGEPEIFLDPNKFSADGTTSLGETGFSRDGTRMAYSISEGGSDWRKIITIDAISREIIGDSLKDIKFSGISWKGNEGFYYSSYDRPSGSELSAMTDHHKLYYHRAGTPQSEDVIVFGADLKRRYVSGYVTDDGRYLIISASVSTTGNELYIMDLSVKNPVLKVIVGNFENNHYVVDNDGTKLFIYTDLNAPNGRVVSVDAGNPSAENWKDFITETENVLSVSTGAGYFFANYLKDAITYVKQIDRSGITVREVTLPGLGSANGFSGKKDDNLVYFAFANYTTPVSIFSFDPANGETKVYKQPVVAFNSGDYESEQVFYNSKDGTRVPMIITHRKGIELDGKNPTLLYGYGGFGISETPEFSIAAAVWLELGGIYAVPNIRGGGEYGETWHIAGTKMNKQNVFDDFIAAAEFLMANKYTSPDNLAVRGGSNGGLMVGDVMTQRPELFSVALPAVGVLDMLRYHKFTAGAGWAYDYGTADDSPEMFRYLLGYSPVHNVREGKAYPATLVTTGDHDDRVVPAHSFKFAAHLQAKQTGPDPVLIRIETLAGHGAGTPVSKTIEQYSDIYSFTLWNMGIRDLK